MENRSGGVNSTESSVHLRDFFPLTEKYPDRSHQSYLPFSTRDGRKVSANVVLVLRDRDDTPRSLRLLTMSNILLLPNSLVAYRHVGLHGIRECIRPCIMYRLALTRRIVWLLAIDHLSRMCVSVCARV